MPKVCINRKQYKEQSIGSWIVGQLFKKKLKRKDLAYELDISAQGLNWKLNNNSFDYGDLLTVFEFLGTSDEEKVSIMSL